MIDATKFKAGMHALGAMFNREITPDVARVYESVLSPKLSTQEWEQAVKRCLDAESFFPVAATLLKYGKPEGSPSANASKAYLAILGRFEQGHRLGHRDIREEYGPAAADAFVAAGGVNAFEWCEPDDQPFRQKRFVDAWVELVDQEPEKALPPGETKLLR